MFDSFVSQQDPAPPQGLSLQKEYLVKNQLLHSRHKVWPQWYTRYGPQDTKGK